MPEPVEEPSQHAAAASATEPATPQNVLLRAQDLPTIRAHGSMAETHRQARELLQLLVNEPGEDVIDISTQWATWRIYLACHPMSLTTPNSILFLVFLVV